ncbi:hypothetical protein E2C01_054375 [Portunus trituberculatus]|uniref:Uncharacterized protein n=1 Tax=Portunus trituberculatus TaxID=210409 RepID=A0A5B7GRV1_PORTR|nr:hypothetical protein [Portunus trituberculatus]
MKRTISKKATTTEVICRVYHEQEKRLFLLYGFSSSVPKLRQGRDKNIRLLPPATDEKLHLSTHLRKAGKRKETCHLRTHHLTCYNLQDKKTEVAAVARRRLVYIPHGDV